MPDFSDHTLTTISTWAVVATLLFMVWEKYVPMLGVGSMTVPLKPQIGVFRSIWENRTAVLAIIGLVIVVWLNFRQTTSQSLPADVSTINDQRGELDPAQKTIANFKDTPTRQLSAVEDNSAIFSSTAKLQQVDKERVSDMFFDAGVFLKEGEDISSRADVMHNRSPQETDKYIDQDISASKYLLDQSLAYVAKYHEFLHKWDYYRTYAVFIVGSDPNNVMTMQNAAQSIFDPLSEWSHIQNKSDPEVGKLLFPAWLRFDDFTAKFRSWHRESSNRLDKIKSAMTQ